MSREEDAVRATTRAIAATVRDVPPLRLEPAPGELWSPGRGPHRGRPGGSGRRPRSWLAPVAAAVVVVAVAVSLVLLRGNPNGSMVPQPTSTAAGPGGVPRYYVALDLGVKQGSAQTGLVVGDAVTGGTLADIAPPAHMSFGSVTGAADDRTFFVFAARAGGSWSAGRWYRLVLAPGTAHVATLTTTAIAPQSGVVASALSGSGKELAVAEDGPAKGQQRVIVFSVATGRPLRAWSTKDAVVMWESGAAAQEALLTWIDGDRAIAFTARDPAAGTLGVRRVNVSGPLGDGDLIADSQLIWSIRMSQFAGCDVGPPLVSADGQAIVCTGWGGRLSGGHDQLTMTWRVFRASAQAPAAARYTTAYQVTWQQTTGSAGMTQGTVWVSPSGSALIGDWSFMSRSQSTPSQVGVLSHGTFTPLRVPPGILPLPPGCIAW